MVWYFIFLISVFCACLKIERKVLDSLEPKEKIRKGGLFKGIFKRKK